MVLDDGSVKIVENIPANAKITFGTIHAGAEKGFARHPYALRIYTTESNQLAVFVGVQEFRDLSLHVRKRVEDSDQTTSVTTSENGVAIGSDRRSHYKLIEEAF